MKKSLIASITLAALLAACSTTPTEQAAPAAPAKPAEAAKPAAAKPAAPAKVDPFAAADALEKIALLKQRSIYFEYDKYDISLDYVTVLEAHSKYLKAQPNAKLVIEGNADERGSREYNLALGQKRAEAVKSNLKMLGAKETQIEAVSFGEEKPKATGSNEEAWAQNRRADLNYGK